MDFKRVNLLIAIAVTVFSPFVIEYSTFRDTLLFPVVFVLAYIAVNVLFWMVVVLISFTARPHKKYTRPSKFYGFVFNSAFCSICHMVGVKIKTRGLKNVPHEPFMLVANHRSKFDNMVISAVLKRPELSFISKPENFKIPFGRRLMARCCYRAIDRENPKNAMVTVNDCAELVKDHKASVGVFPEGKRGKGPGVNEFSDGSFLLAKKAKCGVLVATLKGTEYIHKNFPFRTTDVELEFLRYLTYEEVAEKRSGEISAEVREIIQSNLLSKGNSNDEVCNVQPSCQQ